MTVQADPTLQILPESTRDGDDDSEVGGGYAYAYSEDGDPAVTTYNGEKINQGKRVSGGATGTSNGTSAPNFHTVYRKKSVHDRASPVRFFTTRHTPGSRIRNAITGNIEHARVGSYEEHQYFKVGLSTGELGPDAYGTHLYYDTPDQYERHFGFRLSPEVVAKWYDNFAQAQIQAQSLAQSQVQNTIVR